MTSTMSYGDAPAVILHVAECFEGGVGKAVRLAAEAVPEATHHLLASGADLESQALDMFSTVTPLPDGLLARVRATRQRVRRLGPTTVHAHSSWAGVYTRLLPTAPVVYQPHCYSMETSSGLRSLAYGLAERALSRSTARILVLSPREERLAVATAPNIPRTLFPNAPTVAVQTSGDQPRHKRRVVMSGRIAPQKDPGYFAEVASIVHDIDPAVEFVWIGDGDSVLREQLEHARVQVTGWLDPDAIITILDSATLHLHTASWEGFPLSVLDSAARGLPVLVRDIPAFEGVNLASTRSPADASAALIEAIGSSEIRADWTRRTVDLLKTMNAVAQRTTLRDVYGSVGAA